MGEDDCFFCQKNVIDKRRGSFEEFGFSVGLCERRIRGHMSRPTDKVLKKLKISCFPVSRVVYMYLVTYAVAAVADLSRFGLMTFLGEIDTSQ